MGSVRVHPEASHVPVILVSVEICAKVKTKLEGLSMGWVIKASEKLEFNLGPGNSFF
jgi:hypothetical protein